MTTQEVITQPEVIKPPAELPIIAGLVGKAGCAVLRDDPRSRRLLANTYGVEPDDPSLVDPSWEVEPGDSTPRSPRWVREAVSEVRKVTRSIRSLYRYGRMIVGLAYQEHQSYKDARKDSLTGLPNRLAFYDELEDAIVWGAEQPQAAHVLSDGREVPAETRRGVVVGLADIDYFKDVNDALGHSFGDLIIRRLSRSLRRAIRGVEVDEPDEPDAFDPETTMRLEDGSSQKVEDNPYPDWDVLARLGGDEFGLLLHVHEKTGLLASGLRDREPKTIQQVADAATRRIEAVFAAEMILINEDIAKECERQGKPPIARLRGSFGWHVVGEDDNEAIIIRTVDDAMYDKKLTGKVADASEDRSKLSADELAQIGRIIAVLDTPEFPRYRRVVASLRELYTLAA